jgi:hypothetical protein
MTSFCENCNGSGKVLFGDCLECAPKTHHLKTWPQYFKAVEAGLKTFEIRVNDRSYRVNDVLVLQEWNPETKAYTGKHLFRRVTYLTSFGQPEGQIVMALGAVLSGFRPDNAPE